MEKYKLLSRCENITRTERYENNHIRIITEVREFHLDKLTLSCKTEMEIDNEGMVVGCISESFNHKIDELESESDTDPASECKK